MKLKIRRGDKAMIVVSPEQIEKCTIGGSGGCSVCRRNLHLVTVVVLNTDRTLARCTLDQEDGREILLNISDLMRVES